MFVVVDENPQLAERLLIILSTCLEQCRSALPSLIPEVRSLFEDFILASIATRVSSVRQAGLRALSQCLCLDVDLAGALYSTFFVQLQLEDDGAAPAIKALTDLALAHGFSVFSNDIETAIAISQKLQHNDTHVRRVAGESLSLLLLSGKIPRKQRPNLVARLVQVWFEADLASGRDLDPQSELLRAALAAFFRMYPTQSSASLAAFAEALIPTLKLADDGVFSHLKPHALSAFFAHKISPATNADLPIDLHSQAVTAQHGLALYLLHSVADSVLKLKQTKTLNETLNFDNTKEVPTSLSNPLQWYQTVAVAACSFITTVKVGHHTKQTWRQSDLFNISNKLLAENFEWQLPMALVKRRCKKELEMFAKNLASVLNLNFEDEQRTQHEQMLKSVEVSESQGDGSELSFKEQQQAPSVIECV